MRDIKFRGLRTDGKGWVYGYYWYDNQNKTHKITADLSDDNFRCYKVIPDSIGQFTGLTDKNGKDIYEDDNIKFKDKIYRIVYRDGSFFAISDYETHWIFCLHALDTIDIEVIGKIYEMEGARDENNR